MRIVEEIIRDLLLDAVSGSDDWRLSRHLMTIQHTRLSLSMQVAAVVARSNFEDQTMSRVFPFLSSTRR